MGLERTAGKVRASGGGVQRTWKDRAEARTIKNYRTSRGRIRHTLAQAPGLLLVHGRFNFRQAYS